MLYDVYEKNVGMIEELEKFDNKGPAVKTRSKVSLPSQAGKSRYDVGD